MRTLSRWAFVFVVAVLAGAVARPAILAIQYQPAPRGEAVDILHGTAVPDPYRFLEKTDVPATQAWIAEQGIELARYLSKAPLQGRIHARLRELVAYDAVSPPQRAGNWYVFTKTEANRQTNIGHIYVADSPGADGTLLLDLQSRHGADASLGTFAASPDGRHLAYVIHRSGSAWGTAHLLDLRTGVARSDALADVHRFSRFQWTLDSRDLFYTTFERPADSRAAVRDQTLRRHRLGASRADDQVVPLGSDDAARMATVRVTNDGRYAVIGTQVGTDQRTTVTLLDLETPGARPTPLIPEGDGTFTFLGSASHRLWFYTDVNAPNGRVVEIDVRRPARNAWRTIIPEGAEAIAARDQTGGNALGVFGNRFVLMYLRDGRPFLRIFSSEGTLTHTVDLPSAGSVWGGFSGRQSDPDVYFQFLGMADPSTILHLDVVTGALRTVRRAAIPFDSSRFVVKQEFYQGKDGTRIPVFVVHRKGLVRDGKSPALLYGYGALAWVSFIWYQPQLLTWLEMGGVYAQPAIRGGGEYGKAWHDAALRTKKQTAVDDYLAAAEWLVGERYTSADRLVATGGSLSAPLAAAAIAQKPGLFGAAVIDRPVADLIRYERFTGAAFWTPEFGSVSNRDEFAALLRFSPYHEALKGACLPPTLVMVGEHDQTSPPLHGYKLVAARQSALSCKSPVFLKLMRGAGHDFGKTPAQLADSFTAELTFLSRILQLPGPMPQVSRCGGPEC